MRVHVHLILLVCCGCCSESAPSTAEPTVLKVVIAGRVRSIRPQQLSIPHTDLSVRHPAYKRTLRYRGVWLTQLLGKVGLGSDVERVVFRCVDGYAPSLVKQRIARLRLFLAWRQLGDSKAWDPLPTRVGLVDPGPYLIVSPLVNSYQQFPWPYQVTAIEGIQESKVRSRLYPTGARERSAVLRGYRLFRRKCLNCHSVNLEGGQLGPELNVPKNITEFWRRSDLRQYIRDPRTFRARPKMPSFKGLSDAELEELLGYLEHMRRYKVLEPLTHSGRDVP